jgi:hypothetical protein
MKSPRRRNPIVLALWANAILLAGILVLMLSRSGYPSFLPAALAQPQQQAPIAGGAGVFVMPGQLASNIWGAYLLDVDAGTLVVYQYEPGNRKLRFVAARSYKYDRQLHDMSTEPATEDIHRLVEREKQQGFKGAAGDNANAGPAENKDQ